MRLWTSILVLAGLSAPAFGQGDKWLFVPSDQSAIAVLWTAAPEDQNFSIKDAKGQLLDSAFWKADSPLVKQYRLAPGRYEMSFNGAVPIQVDLQPGQITPIKLDWKKDGIQIDTKPVIDLQKFVLEAMKSGKIVLSDPVEVEPSGNGLQLMAWPGTRPPPPPGK
jgi:hypothetical protein